MEILSIKRPNNGNPTTGLKIYATVRGDEHNGVTQEYKVGYFRRPSFRGWMCSCTNFVLSQFGKGGHCKHIDLIQSQYGRYGAGVGPSKQKKYSFSVGDLVFVPKEINSFWSGVGKVLHTYTTTGNIVRDVRLEMQDGRMKGEIGCFSVQGLRIQKAPAATQVPVQEPGLTGTQGQDSIGQ